MIRDTPYGEIADHYDPMLFRDLDPMLRKRRLDLALQIATANCPPHVTDRLRGRLDGLDEVRNMANQIMEARTKDEHNGP